MLIKINCSINILFDWLLMLLLQAVRVSLGYSKSFRSLKPKTIVQHGSYSLSVKPSNREQKGRLKEKRVR